MDYFLVMETWPVMTAQKIKKVSISIDKTVWALLYGKSYLNTHKEK